VRETHHGGRWERPKRRPGLRRQARESVRTSRCSTSAELAIMALAGIMTAATRTDTRAARAMEARKIKDQTMGVRKNQQINEFL